MSRLRRLTAVALLAAAALVLSGCSLIQSLAPQGSTHTDEDVPAELERFYKQDLSWKSEGNRIDTTKVIVPLDWSDPGGETIEIAIARHHAKGEKLGSLLINPGGPGGSGFDYVRDYAQYVVSTEVLERYDIIGFDPRGVNHSTPVVCYTDGAQRDQWLYGTYDAAYGTQAWVDELTARAADYTAACEENTGPLLAHIDAASVARDMDVIRAVLGDEKINYLGYSYGTYLGAVYAELFAEKVGRMVLDGAVDPQVSDLDALGQRIFLTGGQRVSGRISARRSGRRAGRAGSAP